jgi:hypothetical protein
MKYLLKVTEEYRVDSESEASQLEEKSKKDSSYQVVKCTKQYKERKQKGETVDAWYKVTITKQFTDEKEPLEMYSPSYSLGSTFDKEEN